MRLAIYRWLENNAGDDAVYAGLRTAFPPDVEWVEIHLWEKVDTALALVNACDGLVIGGGTIVGNLPTWILKAPFLDGLAVPVGILGAGIRDEGLAGIRDDLAPALHRLLQRADPIGLRGPLSQRFLEQSGFTGYPLSVVGDPALLLTGAKTDAVGTAINVRARKGGHEQYTVEMLRALLDAKDPGLPEPVSFFSCHDRWDLQPCGPLAEPIAPYEGLETLLCRLGQRRLVISERLHGTVLAHIAGTPAVQIVYERKCVDYMASVGCRDLCVWPGDVEGLRRACAAAEAYLGIVGAKIQQLRRRLRHIAQHFWSGLQSPSEEASL